MTAFKTAIAPIVVTIGSLITTFAPLISILGKVLAWLEKFKVVSASILAFAFTKYLVPLGTSIIALTRAIQLQTLVQKSVAAGQSSMLPGQSLPLARGNLLKTIGKGVGIGIVAIGAVKLLEHIAEGQADSAKALNTLAEAELTRARSDAASRRTQFGQSRFELLSKQIINDSITRVATREAVLINALDSLGAKMVRAIDGTTEAVFDSGAPSVVLSR